MFACSVVICSHNPRKGYLDRVLEALASQTLPQTQWELLLVDNASATKLGKIYDLEWHQHGRHIHESELGLTQARLRGIEEARGKLLVFVDDDNLLATDYLEAVLALSDKFPQLGAFGSAKIIPLYEKEPVSELQPYCGQLALRNEDGDRWTNSPVSTPAVPFGAGLSIRADVAQEYRRKKSAGGPSFGRRGSSLMSAEDIEMSLAATDIGYGYGIFGSLKLTHLISANRVEVDYLLRLTEGTSFSNELFSRMRNQELGNASVSSGGELRLLAGALGKIIFARGIHRRFRFRSFRGRWMAYWKFRRLCNRG